MKIALRVLGWITPGIILTILIFIFYPKYLPHDHYLTMPDELIQTRTVYVHRMKIGEIGFVPAIGIMVDENKHVWICKNERVSELEEEIFYMSHLQVIRLGENSFELMAKLSDIEDEPKNFKFVPKEIPNKDEYFKVSKFIINRDL